MSVYRAPQSQAPPLAAAKQRPAPLWQRLKAWRRGIDRRMAIRARRAYVRVCYPWATWRECQDVATAIHDSHDGGDAMVRAVAFAEAGILERRLEARNPNRPKPRATLRPPPPPTPIPGPGRPISE
jgi:hypothetical protein